ncbi:MAG: hypothetical protein ABIB65_06055 [Candidatus Margulisiibacteriota bacterium]
MKIRTLGTTVLMIAIVLAGISTTAVALSPQEMQDQINAMKERLIQDAKNREEAAARAKAAAEQARELSAEEDEQTMEGAEGSTDVNEAPEEAAVIVVNDYFPEGVHMAALKLVSWEDTVCMGNIYPVTIVTVATKETQYQWQVEPTSTIKAAEEIKGNDWKWTRFVFRSHPAQKDELKVGMWVLCADGEDPKTGEELSTSQWKYRQIQSLDELYKGLVVLTYADTYHHENRTSKTYVENLRVVENPVSESGMSF